MANSSIITKTTDVIRTGREAELRRTDYVCVLVLVDTTAPRSLVLPVKEALDPRMPSSDVRVIGVGRGEALLEPTIPDVCVAILGRNERGIAEGVTELALAGVPVGIVAESALDVPDLALGSVAARRVATLSATSAEVLSDRLAEWLIGATEKDVAMAANFPFCRRAKTRQLVNDFALENATATAKLGPRADLPSMTLSHAQLALNIAAINGQPLALGRIPEVLTAISAGFGSRMMANKALGKLPFVGWFFKVGMGYLGTQATGMTLQHRFDKREKRAEEEERGIVRHESSRLEKIVEALRERSRSRSGESVRSTTGGEVRLLPVEADGGFLVYEQEEVE